ncbi:MAG: sun protein [Deltaproteobacteria bacterium]|nr:sun protein [Deltaproteobacteria bacterium]
MRRHPEGKWQKREKGIFELTWRQRALIENLSRYLKPGGVMVYSVCSVLREEGEGVVDAFLASHKDFILEPAFPKAEDAGERFVCNRGLFKVYSHTYGMDGFFAAKLRKIGNR